MGAWIETTPNMGQYVISQSLPMWERGLKHDCKVPLVNGVRSLPMWERGLKHNRTDIADVPIRRSPCGSVD